MVRKQQITAKLIAAYWQCPRKAFHLLNEKQDVVPHELESIVDRHGQRNNLHYVNRLKDKFGDVPSYTPDILRSGPPVLSSADLEYEDLLASTDVLLKVDGIQHDRKATYVPVIVGGTHSITQEQRIAITFVGIVLARLQKRPCTAGKVVTSDARIHSVQLGKRVRIVHAIIRVLRSWMHEAASSPPGVVLNKNCQLCPFHESCHTEALQIDHLSLLSGLSQKQIQGYNKKGIFTVTQLAYTYRATRSKRQNSYKQLKYKYALKALAVRDNRTYVVKTEHSDIPFPHIYLDVEAIPDQCFFYLIGLLVVTGSVNTQYSFWADREGDEGQIWRQFLTTVGKYDDFTIFHYGSYEGRFINSMARKYNDEDNPLICKIKSRLVNVLGLIYGSIYFPTYSNGLKEIAAYIGYHWTHPEASGLQSIVWRYRWEESKDDKWKRVLITYNQEDCCAAKLVAEAVVRILQRKWDMPGGPIVAGVDSIESESTFKFGKIDFILPDFQHINNCAYYDYQREKVYFRKVIKKRYRSVGRIRPRRKRYRINKNVEIPTPDRCHQCDSTMLYRHGPRYKVVLDIHFTKSGVKRWVIKYQTRRMICRSCGKVSVSQKYHAIRGKYGRNFYALIIYNLIALRQSYGLILEGFRALFGYDIGSMVCNSAKQYFATLYEDTYKDILATLCKGPLVNADETSFNLRSTKSYVWVFTSTTEVAYVYSPTRESAVPKRYLKGFEGVLVSDFFSGYSALDCRKQRCFVHLIRDMNGDLRKNPFDAEFKTILHDFGILMRMILSTIDRYGLKRRFLHKHRTDVEEYYQALSDTDLHSEVAVQYRDRLIRWRDELFTFLDCDGVPWNNNNAEYAVKAFAIRRKSGSGLFTEAGMKRFLILLSVYETCRYREIDFLAFLRSGRTDLLSYPSPIIKATGKLKNP